MIRYDLETGEMYWNERKSFHEGFASFNAKYAGKAIKRRVMMFDCGDQRVEHKKTRIVWLHYYGEWPEGNVYHRNGDQADFRIENLTLAKPPRRAGGWRGEVMAEPVGGPVAEPAAPAGPAPRYALPRSRNRNKPGAKHGVSVDAEVARDFMRFDPITGEVFWCERGREYFASDGDYARWNSKHAGKLIGGRYRSIRMRVKIFDKLYYLDALILLMESGKLPDYVEHLNRNYSDNRLENLRALSRKEKEAIRADKSESGVPGIGIRPDHRGDPIFVVRENLPWGGRRSASFTSLSAAERYKREIDRDKAMKARAA